MLDQKDRRAELVADATEQRAERFRFLLRDAAGRLVEQDQSRLQHQQTGELGHAQRPVAQIADVAVLVRMQVDDLHDLVRALARRALAVRAPGQAQRTGEEAAAHARVIRDEEVVVDRQRREQPHVLERPADTARDALVRQQRHDLFPLQQDAAGGRLDQAADRVEKRRLPGAVRPDQADDLTLVGFDVDVGVRDEPAE